MSTQNKHPFRIFTHDLVVRLFHWLLILGLVSAYGIAELTDDEGSIFGYHQIIGLMLGVLVLYRIFWGLIGSSYARFSSFPFSITDLTGYLKQAAGGKTQQYLTHNPASCYFALATMMLVLTIVGSGVAMSLAISVEFFEELHELAINLLLIAIVLHIVGLILHQKQHNDGLASSMLTGYKNSVQQGKSVKPHLISSALLILLLTLWGGYLISNIQANKLTIFGTSLTLGEPEGEHETDESEQHEEEHEQDKAYRF